MKKKVMLSFMVCVLSGCTSLSDFILSDHSKDYLKSQNAPLLKSTATVDTSKLNRAYVLPDQDLQAALAVTPPQLTQADGNT